VDLCALERVWVEWLNDRSRMNGDIHVRVCESLWGKFPLATRPKAFNGLPKAPFFVYSASLHFCTKNHHFSAAADVVVRPICLEVMDN